MKEWLKSVLNYRSYPKNKTGYPFFLEHPVRVFLDAFSVYWLVYFEFATDVANRDSKPGLVFLPNLGFGSGLGI